MLATEYLDSASLMVAYYQHECQRFAPTLKLLLYRIEQVHKQLFITRLNKRVAKRLKVICVLGSF